jgi:hypothetical protein
VAVEEDNKLLRKVDGAVDGAVAVAVDVEGHNRHRRTRR